MDVTIGAFCKHAECQSAAGLGKTAFMCGVLVLAHCVTVPHTYTHCVPHTRTHRYNTADFSGEPRVHYEDGDNTVPLKGLAVCEQWKSVAGHPAVESRVWKGVRHADVLRAPGAMDYVVNTIIRLARSN